MINYYCPFFCALNFFTYLCCMKNTEKTGKAILDKHIKFIKKKTKDTVIKAYQNTEFYLESDLKNSVIKIKSIRKYKHIRTLWSDDKEQYTYEVDVIVDLRPEKPFRYNSNYWCQYRSRRYNNYYRGSILNVVLDDLKYFGIDRTDNVLISKIEYKDIV